MATLLLVDDNPVERAWMASVLLAGGHNLAVAADGQEALDYLALDPAPGLILLDMLLPGVDGWAFMERKNRSPELAAVPVLIVTGIPVATAEWAADLGAVGFIRKPVDPSVLLQEVEQALRGPG